MTTRAQVRALALEDLEHIITLALEAVPDSARAAAITMARTDLMALDVTEAELDAAGIR